MGVLVLLRPIRIILPAVLFLIINCNENGIGPPIASGIIGTWKEYHSTRYNSSGVIIEDLNTVDSVWMSMFTNGNSQHARIMQGFKYLVYERYNYDNSLYSKFPDSLLDSIGVIHYWNSVDSSYTPPYPVKSTPFTSEMVILNGDTLKETRIFSTQKLVLFSARKQTVPIDLKSKIIH